MKKQIIAWVNKMDKKQLKQYPDLDIYFATSINDFENHLTDGVSAILTITKAGRYYKIFNKIIANHPEIKFYFTEKFGMITYGELTVLEGDNVHLPMARIPLLIKHFI
jgi:hypothetical protein